MAAAIRTNVTLNIKDMNAAVLSYRSSKRYIQKAFPISIINILYNRINFPEGEFENEGVRDIQYVVSKKISKHKYIQQFNRWIKGAKHALDRDYLKDFYLMIKDTDGVLKEYYRFSFFYNTDNIEEGNKVNKDLVYKQTLELFNGIKVLSLFPKWNEEDQISLSVEIAYNDKVPLVYEPPYYERCESKELEVVEYMNANVTKKYKFETLKTGYHLLKFRFGGEKLSGRKNGTSSTSSVTDLCEVEHIVDENIAVHTVGAKNNSALMNKDKFLFDLNDSDDEKQPIVIKRKLSAEENLTYAENNHEKIIKKPKLQISNFNSRSVNNLTNTAALDDIQIIEEPSTFCICESSVTHAVLPIFTCVKCKKLFHCACLGYLKRREVPKRFNCLKCRGSSFLPVEIEDVTTYRLRLLFAFCYLTKEVPDKIMEGFPKSDQNALWHRLEQLEIIENKSEGYCVNHAKINDDCLLKEVFGNGPNSMQFTMSH